MHNIVLIYVPTVAINSCKYNYWLTMPFKVIDYINRYIPSLFFNNAFPTIFLDSLFSFLTFKHSVSYKFKFRNAVTKSQQISLKFFMKEVPIL